MQIISNKNASFRCDNASDPAMKYSLSLWSGLLVFFMLLAVHADTVTWTNGVGGNWSDAGSWNPNQVPGPGDDALITNSGSYVVTLDISPTVNSLVLGGGSGTQTLAMAANDLTLNSASTVLAHGDLQLSGGLLGGDSALVINGRLDWTAGVIGATKLVTVATNGLLHVEPAIGSVLELAGIMTNNGTVTLTNGGLRCIIYAGYGGGYGLLVNAASGLIDLQSNSLINVYNDFSGSGVPAVVNYGTVAKSSGSDTTTISPLFYNSGTLDAHSGTISLNGSGQGNGIFEAETGATIAYPANYEMDGTISGAGTNLLPAGVLTLGGSISGQLVWTGGLIGPSGVGTVAANGLLLVASANASFVDLAGIITNNGTIAVANGGIRCIVFSGYGGGYGLLVNAASGLIDLQSNSLINSYDDFSEPDVPTVVNYGTVRKSSGSDTTLITPLFYNWGILDAESGTLGLNGGGRGNGIFRAAAGTTLGFENDYEVDSTLSGAGTNYFSHGTITLNGWLNTANSVLAGDAILAGTNGMIASHLEWIAGQIGATGTLSVTTNGALNVIPANGSFLDMLGVVTNNGSITVTNGGIRCIVYYGYGGGNGLLVNAASGLLDLQSNSFINYYNDNTGVGTPAIVNYGTLRKSSGSDTSPINPPLSNFGTLDVQCGTLSLAGAYDLTGGTLNFGLTSLTNFGTISLSGSPAGLTGTLSVNVNQGYVPIRGDAFALLTYGSLGGSFAIFNLPAREAWTNDYGATTFTLTVLNSAPTLPVQTNQVVNEETTLTITNTATDLDLPPDTLTYSLLSAPTGVSISAAGVITWTPDEAQGPGTNTIVTRVADNGTPSLSATNSFLVVVNEVNVAPVLPAQTNRVINELTTLTVTNTATDHDLPVNPLTYTLLQAPANAVIDSDGGITWTPTEAQGPSTNTFITVVTDTNVYAVNAKSLSATNTFTVVVNEVNTPPVLTLPANTSINELTLYTNNAAASDPDIPANTLTFSLVSGPANLTVSPVGGIAWTPTEAQGPSTNVVQVAVTDFNPWAVNAQHLSTTNAFTIIVNEVNTAPVLAVPATQTINELATLTATATATDADLPANPLTFSLVSPLPGMAINASSGSFTWTPTEVQGPSTNTVTVVVTDTNVYAVNARSLSTTNTFFVVVNEVNTAPVLGALANRTVNAGQTASFTAAATDADVPANTLTFSLVSPPTGASIDPVSGIFSWRPSVALANTTNTVQVQVTDFNPYAINAQHLSDAKTFTVVVNPLAPVVLTPVSHTPSQFILEVAGTAGPDYIISASTTLAQWVDLATNLSPATPFSYTDTHLDPAHNRFYRARLAP